MYVAYASCCITSLSLPSLLLNLIKLWRFELQKKKLRGEINYNEKLLRGDKNLENCELWQKLRTNESLIKSSERLEIEVNSWN